MKKTILALVLMVCGVAHAHVLLTTAYSVTGPLGVTTCSAPHATAQLTEPIMNGATVTGVSITYFLGTATFSGGLDTAWVTSTCAPTYTFAMTFSTGQWTLNINVPYGGSSQVAYGTMTGTILTTAISNYQTETPTQFIDTADQFLTVTGSGLLQTALGTQPDKWASGDN